jgi:mannosyltransferase OCH1-like enzyme
MAAWAETWKYYHPKWEYKLWTDVDNFKLVETHYPWFLPTYKSLPSNIQRADVVRYIYMHHFGGVYADLDIECLKPLEELISTSKYVDSENALLTLNWKSNNVVEKSLVTPSSVLAPPEALLPLMSSFETIKTYPADKAKRAQNHNIPNAFLASRPKHPFWFFLLKQIMAKSNEMDASNKKSTSVEYWTGMCWGFIYILFSGC